MNVETGTEAAQFPYWDMFSNFRYSIFAVWVDSSVVRAHNSWSGGLEFESPVLS
jgi:hypothetical protein